MKRKRHGVSKNHSYRLRKEVGTAHGARIEEPRSFQTHGIQSDPREWPDLCSMMRGRERDKKQGTEQ